MTNKAILDMVTMDRVQDDDCPLATDLQANPEPGSFNHGLNVAVNAFILVLLDEERRGNVSEAWLYDVMQRAQFAAEKIILRSVGSRH
jgi:hypothetical protein